MAIDERAARIFARRGVRVAWLGLAALVLVGISYGSCTTYVPPGQVGLKQRQLGTNSGISKELYWPGLHYLGAGERLLMFPTELQVLEMTSSKSEGSDEHRVVPALNIQTSEGYTVTVDVTLLYRITDPYLVVTGIGPGRLFESSAVQPRAETVMRRALGELNAEDFYAGNKREQKVREASVALDTDLSDKGLRVVQLFVRSYHYDPRYQAAIEQRKIQDQSVYKNQAEAEAAAAEAEKNRIVATGEAEVSVVAAEGDAEVQHLRSQAELYRRQKAAEGELLLALAKAQGTDLENKALRGAGSEAMVGLEMAKVLAGTRAIVLPSDSADGLNPLDLRSALKKFDVKEGP